MRMLEFSNRAMPQNLRLVDRKDPVLWTPAAEVTDIEAQVWPHLEDMVAIMRFGPARGVGLAAPQVGIPLRFFITNYEYFAVVINPTILQRSQHSVSRAEGCLSWNDGKSTTFVRRPEWVRASYTDRNGEAKSRTFTGFDARVFCHESDHLDGVCIFPKQ
jgi:peptide deformylase